MLHFKSGHFAKSPENLISTHKISYADYSFYQFVFQLVLLAETRRLNWFIQKQKTANAELMCQTIQPKTDKILELVELAVEIFAYKFLLLNSWSLAYL